MAVEMEPERIKDLERFGELAQSLLKDAVQEDREDKKLQKVLKEPRSPESDLEVDRLAECKAKHLVRHLEIALYREEFQGSDDWYDREDDELDPSDESDPFEDAAVFAAQLAGRSRPEAAVRFSLKFQKALSGRVSELVKASEDWRYWRGTSIWEAILEECPARAKDAALSAILDVLEARANAPECDQVALLVNHVSPKLAARILALIDRGLEEEKGKEWYVRQTRPPYWVNRRIAVMEAVGRADEVDGYLDANFPDCAFTMRNRMLKLKKQKDFQGAAEICKKLSTFEPLCKADRKAFEKQLPGLLKAAGLDPDVYAATEGGLGSVVPGLEKLQESATDAEWHEALSRAVERVIANPDKEPRLLAFSDILAREGDSALLWDFLRRADRKKLWLAYFHFLKAHHPEELAEALLRHYAENPNDPGWPHQITPKRTVYESWAKDILLVAKIKGQRTRALEFARELVEQHPTLRMLKTVFQERGLY